MTPEYILSKSLCRKPHCGSDDLQVNARRAQSEIECMNFAPAYAESEYTQPERGILFANWNYFPSEVTSLLEKYGYAIEWSDDWSTCGECGKAVRTSADSYSWQPSYVILHECEIVCVDCLNGDSGEYLESLEDKPSIALNIPNINPADYGYALVKDGFENGFHPGQNDDPKRIYAELTAAGHKRILFVIDSVGQFDISFQAWEHIESEA